MSVINVKITDLEEYEQNQIKDSDLFIKASFVGLNSSNAKTYVSETTDVSSIAALLTNNERTVSNKWTFDTKDNPSLQTTKFNPINFFSDYVLDPERVQFILDTDGEDYGNNNVFFSKDYDPKKIEEAEPPVSTQPYGEEVSKLTIANLDYVNKVTAAAHNSLLELFSIIPSVLCSAEGYAFLPSFVGDIIFTTYNYENDNALRAIYGDGNPLINDESGGIVIVKPNTHWVKHSGDFVFRCSADKTAVIVSREGDIHNADGGSNNTRSIPLPTHGHNINSSHSHGFSSVGNFTTSVSLVNGVKGDVETAKNTAFHGGSRRAWVKVSNKQSISLSDSTTSGKSTVTNTNSAGSGVGVDIRQASKRVYVWERVA